MLTFIFTHDLEERSDFILNRKALLNAAFSGPFLVTKTVTIRQKMNTGFLGVVVTKWSRFGHEAQFAQKTTSQIFLQARKKPLAFNS
ncbi:MAG: hypothetical protein GXZ05_05205 [Gammaproteobacteria bacterium]|nr:hypothetical protein [Gammaproteobacteria bacterium]